jgi:hypothetical protein
LGGEPAYTTQVAGRSIITITSPTNSCHRMPADWAQAYVGSLKIGRLGLPKIVAVTE